MFDFCTCDVSSVINKRFFILINRGFFYICKYPLQRERNTYVRENIESLSGIVVRIFQKRVFPLSVLASRALCNSSAYWISTHCSGIIFILLKLDFSLVYKCFSHKNIGIIIFLFYTKFLQWILLCVYSVVPNSLTRMLMTIWMVSSRVTLSSDYMANPWCASGLNLWFFSQDWVI